MVGGREYIKKHFSIKHIAKYFHTRSPVSAADIDGWRARERMAPLLMGDDEELQALIRDHMVLPYLFGDFHPSHIQEYAGGLLFALERPAKGNIHWNVPSRVEASKAALKQLPVCHATRGKTEEPYDPQRTTT